MNDEPGGIGHNQPPERWQTMTRDELLEEARALVKHTNKWRAERPTITDGEMAKANARFIAQPRAIRDEVKAKRADELKPHNDAMIEVRAAFADDLSMLDAAVTGQVLLSTNWLKAERDRLAEERREQERKAEAATIEAARLAREAQQPGATVEIEVAAKRAEADAAKMVKKVSAAPKPVQVKDDFAPKAQSLRTDWRARIIDEKLAIKSYGKQPEVYAAQLDAITKLASRDAHLAKDVTKAKPGIEYYVRETAV